MVRTRMLQRRQGKVGRAQTEQAGHVRQLQQGVPVLYQCCDAQRLARRQEKGPSVGHQSQGFQAGMCLSAAVRIRPNLYHLDV